MSYWWRPVDPQLTEPPLRRRLDCSFQPMVEGSTYPRSFLRRTTSNVFRVVGTLSPAESASASSKVSRRRLFPLAHHLPSLQVQPHAHSRVIVGPRARVYTVLLSVSHTLTATSSFWNDTKPGARHQAQEFRNQSRQGGVDPSIFGIPASQPPYSSS